MRCFNAPHNWQLGWGSPLITLTKATLPVATWVTFTLPAQNRADQNMILIQPDWNAKYKYGNPYSWFLSYRCDCRE